MVDVSEIRALRVPQLSNSNASTQINILYIFLRSLDETHGDEVSLWCSPKQSIVVHKGIPLRAGVLSSGCPFRKAVEDSADRQ